MKLKFKIVVKQGPRTLHEIKGIVTHDTEASNLTVGEMDKIVETEQFLERLTGLRYHIEQVA